MPLSITLSVSLRRVASLHRMTRLGSNFCLSPPRSVCLFGDSQARTHGQGLGPRFSSLHQAQSVSSPSRGLTLLNKAWVHDLPLSSRLSVCHRRVAGSNRATRPGSTLCLSPPDSACLIAESLSRTAGQGLGPSFASLFQAHCFSFTSSGLAPQV